MTQFKEALDDIDKSKTSNMSDSLYNEACHVNADTICLALKIADRVMGEPSGGMIDAANQKMYMLPVYDMETATQTFKIGVRAMNEQMIRELEPSA